jgi:hypothetical protein
MKTHKEKYNEVPRAIQDKCTWNFLAVALGNKKANT